ncbi:MAG: dienelactone hydrolase family protein [Cyclobacteriaceae bacterium]|nr:dienelactone hydrolase family protein [Cyclobacteriaceae bacterium]
MKKGIFLLFYMCFFAFSQLIAQKAKQDVGQFHLEIQSHADNRSMSLSYLSKDWPDLEAWRLMGRAKMNDLLNYAPIPVPLNAVVLDTIKKEGYTRYIVEYSITEHRRGGAFLLVPDGLTEPAPAVIALHDHGGFYFFGKEKIVETENPPEDLRQFIDRSYGGRTYADELARRGFVVLCPDAFYFGSQRIDISKVSENFTRIYPELQSSDEKLRIAEFNRFANAHENIMARYIFGSGATWPGILFHGDRIAVDYLLSLPQVDPKRIGCTGLSIGGFRSAHLFAMDSRISVCVDAGWMTSYPEQIDNHFRNHTWMIYIPGQLDWLDLPDVTSLSAPKPLMVINCIQDNLYTMAGMQSAVDKLDTIYKKLNASDRFQVKWYDVPHSFNVEMQDDAMDWLEHWLK